MPLFQGADAAPQPRGMVVDIGFAPVANANAPNLNDLAREAQLQRHREAQRRARMLRPFDILAHHDEDLDEGQANALIEEMERMEALEYAVRNQRRINRLNELDMSQVEEAMKVRHLTKNEREQYHNPKPDWHDTPKGDMCKNAVVLEVEDIIRKHIK